MYKLDDEYGDLIKPANIKTEIERGDRRNIILPADMPIIAEVPLIEEFEGLEQTEPLNSFEEDCITNWIENGYLHVNWYLKEKIDNHNFIISGNSGIVEWLKRFILQDEGEPDKTYVSRMLYIYVVNLYTIIQRAPAYPTPFKVYRGARSKASYLKEEGAIDRFYYLNQFTATTIDKKVAYDLLTEDFQGNFASLFVYVFLVHPGSTYKYLFQNTTDEKEVLLTPYHRYVYIDTIKEDDITYKRYVILPTDLEIPKTFEGFVEWKDGEMLKGGRNLRGGTRYGRGVRRIRALPHKSKAREQTRRTTILSKSEKLNRFIDPIVSTPGKVLSPAEKKVVAEIVKFFGEGLV